MTGVGGEGSGTSTGCGSVMPIPLVNSCVLHDGTQGVGIPAPTSPMEKLRSQQRYLQSYNLRFLVTRDLRVVKEIVGGRKL